jgi:hypothetical protein
MRLIKEYDEYAKDLPMIIESKVEFSDKFCDVVKKIDSPLSKVILSLQNTEKDIEKNYLDLGKGNDSISFVIDAKAKTLGEPWKQSRNEIRVGKIVRSLIKLSGESFTEKQIEDFVNKFKAVMDSKGSFERFEIVSGEEILKYYNINNYEDFDEGQLGHSCLNNKPHAIFDMYVMNPNIVKLVILKVPGSEKIIGRALLWKVDFYLHNDDYISLEDEDDEEIKELITLKGELFMDRIYTSKDSDVDLFKMYAYSINAWTKELQTSSYKYREDFHYWFNVQRNGEMKEGNMIVQLDNYGFRNFDTYPYLDTFCYYNRDKGLLCNDRFQIGADILVCNTDGGYKDSDFEW